MMSVQAPGLVITCRVRKTTGEGGSRLGDDHDAHGEPSLQVALEPRAVVLGGPAQDGEDGQHHALEPAPGDARSLGENS